MTDIKQQILENQVVDTIALVEQPQPLIENPALWLKDGDSLTNNIVATAMLLLALSRLLQVVLPYWSNKK
ncbi:MULTISPECIES: hypothetical protein [Moorena]|uniref:Uncharacterized protein n=1 Tax=Moorena producens 3L TaxID=489825 RepID=F4XQZ5_9CYAN|nr:MULTISPECIES: hypothetical protein [Moorena]EGJ32970.1 hypothetical protein LYNGBM3L_55600 [Moorena producens 3L]NEP68436.1 hypothetical protein [Moorena sp. SIO3A5]OLT64522.1 hypothetical protein BI334_05340 [Moorena producens 3L]